MKGHALALGRVWPGRVQVDGRTRGGLWIFVESRSAGRRRVWVCLHGRGLEGDELCGMDGKEKIGGFMYKCVGSKLSAQTELVAQEEEAVVVVVVVVGIVGYRRSVLLQNTPSFGSRNVPTSAPTLRRTCEK